MGKRKLLGSPKVAIILTAMAILSNNNPQRSNLTGKPKGNPMSDFYFFIKISK